MSAHTPGPWALRQPRTRLGKDYRIEGADSTVGVLSSKYNTRIAADAARIVACVNACEGLDDPAAVRAQIQTLRAALESVHAALTGGGGLDCDDGDTLYRIVRAALEETK